MRIDELKSKPNPEAEFDKLAEKKDACYSKVNPRYKVWPQLMPVVLVRCRKSWCKELGQ